MGLHRRKLQAQGSSEEHYNHIDGSCSIEFFCALKDPYRVAPANKVPVPWPIFMAISSDAGRRIFDELMPQIRKLLAEYKINVRGIGVYSMAARSMPEKAKDTIRIQTLDESNPTWIIAASRIYAIVEKAAASAAIKMRVEIQNPEKTYRDMSSVITDNKVIEVLAEIKPAIRQAVLNGCPGLWTSIAYHNRREIGSNSVQKPTIIVYIEPGSKHPWQQFEENIFNVIESARASHGVEIFLEILPGCIFPSVLGKSGPKVISSLRNLPIVPSNAASIAPLLSTKEAGTLGTVVYYHPGGKSEKVKCFLTCYHVVALGDPTGKKFNDKNGIGLDGRKVSRKIDIDYPAKCDANETKQFLTRRIAEIGDANGSDAAILSRLQSIANGGTIGHVIYASGNLTLNDAKHRMDWALVALNSPGPGGLMLNLALLTAEIPSHFLPENERYEANSGDKIAGMGGMVKSSWYGKVGRTTEITAGYYNGIKRDVSWKSGLLSEEHELITLNDMFPFAAGGDSGSMVFNAKKEWVGMLCAIDNSGNSGLVTSVQDIIKDIQEKTGGTITLA